MSDARLVPLALLARARGMSVDSCRRSAQRGEIAGARQDAAGAWLVPQSEVECAEQHAAGERAATIAAESVPVTHPALRDAAYRFHRAGIEQEIVLRELQAAAIRAAIAGDVPTTRLVDSITDALRGSQYEWDAGTSTWRITSPAGTPQLVASARGTLTFGGAADATVSHSAGSHADAHQ